MPEQEKSAPPWPDLSTPPTNTQHMIINYRGKVMLDDVLDLLFRRLQAVEAQLERQRQ